MKGRRERNKEEKLERIKVAAQRLFRESGYEATTMRNVASLADVGLGTVSFYALGKRELVFLIVNDDFEIMVDEVFDNIDTTLPILDQLLRVFERVYEFWNSQGVTKRFLLRELAFDISDGLPPQEHRFDTNRTRFIEGITGLIDLAMDRGEVCVVEESRWITRVVIAIYQAEARVWISHDGSDIQQATTALRRSLSLFVDNIGTLNRSPENCSPSAPMAQI